MNNNCVHKLFFRGFDLTGRFRLFKFALVGGSGVIVNMGMLWFLTEICHFYYLISSLLAIELSIVNNFTWNYLWTWRDRTTGTKQTFLARMIKYHVSVALAAAGNWILLGVFKEALGFHILIANGIGIVGGFSLNYTLSHHWVFR